MDRHRHPDIPVGTEDRCALWQAYYHFLGAIDQQ
jgi:hypothetical protein